MTIYHYIFWLLMGVLTAHFAHKRGRDPFLWFFIGVILGVFWGHSCFYFATCLLNFPRK